MRKLCRRHLEAYQSLKIEMEIEGIQGEQKPLCSYPGCTMDAQYDIKIEQNRGVVSLLNAPISYNHTKKYEE